MSKGWTWAVVLGLLGCHSGLGELCDARTPCPEGLVCGVPPLPKGGLEDPKGVCDYPLKREGEPCSQAAECDAALTCSTHFTANTRYGECVPRRAPGEACFLDRDCLTKCEGGSGDVPGTCAG